MLIIYKYYLENDSMMLLKILIKCDVSFGNSW